MGILKTVFVIALLIVCQSLHTTADHAQHSNKYATDGTTGNIINGAFQGGQTGRAIETDGNEAIGIPGTGASRSQSTTGGNFAPNNDINFGTFDSAGPRLAGLNFGAVGQGTTSGAGVNAASFRASGAGVNAASSRAGVGVGGAGIRSDQAGVGVGGAGVRFAQAGVGSTGFNTGGRGGIGAPGFGSGQGATRVIEAPVTPTVTKTVTIDHIVTLTDLAFHSVPVTLTDLVVRTTTLTTGQVIRTPVDDRVALQTTVVIRPTSLTVTCSKYYYNVVTDVSVDYFTIIHTSYLINQVTYTTTATQLLQYTSTMVRTIVHTQRTTVTDYHTITNTVYGHSTDYYY